MIDFFALAGNQVLKLGRGKVEQFFMGQYKGSLARLPLIASLEVNDGTVSKVHQRFFCPKRVRPIALRPVPAISKHQGDEVASILRSQPMAGKLHPMIVQVQLTRRQAWYLCHQCKRAAATRPVA
jgi:hypothetical protein